MSDNFALEFAKSSHNANFNQYISNPILVNQYLKNVNMNPVVQSRDRLKQIINSPKDNEQTLRRLSQHIYDTQMLYKRMIHTLSDMLTFDWYPVPINMSKEDMGKKSFEKDFETMCDWFDKFNVKKEFSKAMLKMSQEDGYFTYLREDSDGDMFLQEMPIDWCLIDGSWKYGYLYSFNLMHFQELGADINGFPKEFKTYYKGVLDIQKNKTYYPNIKVGIRNGRWAYWQQLNPDEAWVFKFHTHFAGLIPPFLGVFLDFVDIPMLKEIQNAKSELEAYKIIIGTVPRFKDDRSGNKPDNFAIDSKTLADFAQLIKNSMLNKYVDFKAVPLENLEMFSFDDASNKEDVLYKAFNNLSSQTGIDHSLFNTERPNVATLNLSKVIDKEFVSRLYSQFEEFCTYHVNKRTKKFKFKIKMCGTIYDKEERMEQAKNDMMIGLFTPKLAANYGMSIKELQNGMALMDWLGVAEKLTPIQPGYTIGGKGGVAGRPPVDDNKLTDAGEITKTAGSNINKEVVD